MENLLSPGRPIWIRVEPGDGVDAFFTKAIHITKFKQFLPAGPVATSEAPSLDGIRKRSLVQVFTDPGGLRTLAVAEIRLKDPGRTSL